MKRKLFVVVNPKAGHYDEYLVHGYLENLLSREDISGELYRFVNQQGLAERMKEAKQKTFDCYIAVGGDGIVALLASYLQDRRTPIGIIPAGTSNTLANILSIPLDIKQAIQLLLHSRQTKTIDALRIEDRLFFMNVSTGFSSSVIKDLDSTRKSILGIFAYILAGLLHLPKTTQKTFSVTIDGKRQQVEAAELFVANSGVLGRSQYTVSNSMFDDGVLEVCIVNKPSIRGSIDIVLDILIRKQKKGFHLIGQGTCITVSTEQPLPVQADGDIIGETPITVEVLPRAATFIVPVKTSKSTEKRI
jgi:diacylglycerol kinase (ATP)